MGLLFSAWPILV